MAIVKRNVNDLFPTSLWDDFFNTDFYARGVDLGTKIPAVNTKETDKAYELEMAAPGMNKGDFNVNVDNNVLTISSEAQQEHDSTDGEKVTRQEYSYSSFQRSFQLPDNVDDNAISAKYEDGVLKIELPKTEKGKEANKQITIQ